MRSPKTTDLCTKVYRWDSMYSYCLPFIVTPAKVYVLNRTDTTSSSGVQFTSIPTAADSIAMRKKMNAAAAKKQH